MSLPTESVLREIVEAACTAPSVHNTQPWRWTVRGETLRLHADTSRQLMYADRDRRDLLISCGAALHLLEVAARAHGWATHVTRTADDDDLLATVRFTPAAPDADDLRLAQAIARRRTDRRQVSSWQVPEGRLEQLVKQAARVGVLGTVVPERQHGHLYDVLAAAAREAVSQDAYLDELLAWTHSRTAEGIPSSNLLDREASASAEGGFSRFPAGSLRELHHEDADPEPAWLLLSTTSDGPISWLRTGEALASVWLTCTMAGLSLVPFTQPIEVESTRRQLMAELLDDGSSPQVLMRIGWPPISRDPVAPTPRRPVDLVLGFEG